ncbi:MAG: MXAN_6521/LA_1396 family lipoprotein [Planctomycetota bacterium]|jgi:probable lipoprotein (TIGR04455 family)
MTALRSLALCLSATLGLSLASLSGCVVKSTYVSPDFDAVHKQSLKRVAVLVKTPAGTSANVTELAGVMARRYVNQKRDFIVYRNAAWDGGEFASDTIEGCNGVITLDFTTLVLEGDDADVELEASLVTLEGEKVWSATGSLSEETENEDLTRIADRYARDLGAEVKPYVAPIFIVEKRVFDTLPNPELNDDDVMEKIEL